MALGALGLIIVASIVMAILGSAGKANVNDMVLAVQQQQELIRVAEIGVKDSRGTEAKNLAATAFYTLESDQSVLQEYVNKSKKMERKEIEAGKDEQTTEALTTAKQANRFDEEFITLLKNELREYQATLKKVHDAAPKKSQPPLAEQYRHIGLLIGESE